MNNLKESKPMIAEDTIIESGLYQDCISTAMTYVSRTGKEVSVFNHQSVLQAKVFAAGKKGSHWTTDVARAYGED